MWFDSWSDIGRVLLVGAAAYVVLVIILRVSGKRSLSQLNAFDLVATVALGSTLATILLSSDVSWTEGVAAFALLAGLQLAVALASSRIRWARTLIASSPSLILWKGEIDEEALRRNRLAPSELLQAIRSSGYGDTSAVGAAILETNGSISVIGRDALGDSTALGHLAPE